MDAISQLLRMARLGASLDRRCLLSRATRMDVARGAPGEAPFHVLLDGECRLEVGGTSLAVKPGDVVVIPSGTPHRVTTSGDGDLRGTADSAGDAVVTSRSEGGGPSVIDLFCGRYTFDAGAGAMLLRSLPDPVHVSFGHSAESAEMLQSLAALMRNEVLHEGEGTAAVLSAMCTVLLAMVLRTPQSARATSRLWTAASDRPVAAAVHDILSDPGAEWSIERLSRASTMSRATFQRRFVKDTGMTVGDFVARARLMRAAELLGSTDDTVSAISRRVGYRSESAFSRAFKEAVGSTPARFRRDHQARSGGR